LNGLIYNKPIDILLILVAFIMLLLYTFSGSGNYPAYLNYCPSMIQETKSVGAEINWGVRFNDNKDVGHFCFSFLYHCSAIYFHALSLFCWLQAEHFLINLCKEVSLRLQGCGVQGRTVTLKVVSTNCTDFSFPHLYNKWLI
jgi:hypothetical protein